MIIYHPSILLLSGAVAMACLRKMPKLVYLLAVTIPVIALMALYLLPYHSEFGLLRFKFICQGSFNNKLIATALLIGFLIANLNAIASGKIQELLLGSIYAAFSVACLLAGDFISMLGSLELMMIASTALIFIGNKKYSIIFAQKYLMTHFISGTLLLVGVAYLASLNLTVSPNLAIINITHLLNDHNYSSIMIYSMLLGMIINIGMFPFSGWMVECYKHASNSGFLYLISFTTKVSLIILVKIFAGLECLKYIAVASIIYCSAKVIFEENMLAILSYLSIIAMSIMLIGISTGNKQAIDIIVYYLFLHIIYKILLGLCTINTATSCQDLLCNNLNRAQGWLINVGFAVSIAMMLGIPLLPVFSVKYALSHLISDSITYMAIIVANFASTLALPWKIYFSKIYFSKGAKDGQTSTSIAIKIALLLNIAVIITITIFGYTKFSLIETDFFNIYAVKTLLIILFALILAFKLNYARYSTKPINLIENLGNIFCFLSKLIYKIVSNNKQAVEKEDEYWDISSLEYRIKTSLFIWHDQQKAIYIIFVMLIVLFIAMVSLFNQI